MIRYLLKFVALTVTWIVTACLLLTLLISSDTQRSLRRENRMYARRYAEMKERTEMLGDVVAGLQKKDNDIYHSVFSADAPGADPAGSLDFLFGSDTIPANRMWRYTADKAEMLVRDADEIEEHFRSILLRVASDDFVAPPMSLPLKGISYAQTGAGNGLKLSPFLKAKVQHDGLDLIDRQGTPVYATADGVVAEVTSSRSGRGNSVLIRHDGGYETFYAHLYETSVSQGQTVRRGAKIGTLGMSGKAFAPHLHYELHKDGKPVDPVHYVMASVTPEEYANMLYVAINTEQSMD